MIRIKLTNTESHIENEDYFSLRIVYDSSVEGIRHIGFYYEDEDLLEISVNKESCMIKRIQVTLCHHYTIVDDLFDISSITPVNEEVKLELPDHNDCNYFNMAIYKNCVDIHLSDLKSSKYIRCGQTMFGLDQNDNIVSLIVTELTETDREHILSELSQQ